MPSMFKTVSKDVALEAGEAELKEAKMQPLQVMPKIVRSKAMTEQLNKIQCKIPALRSNVVLTGPGEATENEEQTGLDLLTSIAAGSLPAVTTILDLMAPPADPEENAAGEGEVSDKRRKKLDVLRIGVHLGRDGQKKHENHQGDFET
eukprot:2055570-Rhodomonas_salina.1